MHIRGRASSGGPAATSDSPLSSFFVYTWEQPFPAPHETPFFLTKKSSVSSAPFPIQACRPGREGRGPVQAARLSSSIPAAASFFLFPLAAERASTYSPFLCRGLPRNENGRHRRMLNMFCPSVGTGVLLWPICHPYIQSLAPSPPA
jgi:hypothetical protein